MHSSEESRVNSGKPRRWGLIGLLLVSAFVTIVYVYNVIQIDRLLRDLRNLEKEQFDLEYDIERLKSELIELESPERIVPLARDKMGMIQPELLPEEIGNK